MPQILRAMIVENEELYESPTLSYSVYFDIVEPEWKARIISSRIRYLFNKLQKIKREIERSNSKL